MEVLIGLLFEQRWADAFELLSDRQTLEALLFEFAAALLALSVFLGKLGNLIGRFAPETEWEADDWLARFLLGASRFLQGFAEVIQPRLPAALSPRANKKGTASNG